MNSILQMLRRIISVHAPLSLPAGIPGSPLDARAMNLSTSVTESVFKKHSGFNDIAEPFHKFFAPAGRARSDQALKKALNLIIEERMRVLALRADPPTRHGFDADPVLPSGAHPLDEAAWAALGAGAGARPGGVRSARFKMLLLTAVRAARLLRQTLWTGVRFGRRSVECAESVLGVPAAMGIMGRGNWQPLETAAREAGLWRDGAITVVDELDDFNQPCEYPVVRISELPVPLFAWARQVIWPSFCLAAFLLPRACAWAWRDSWRAQLAYEALVMAEQSLPMRRLCFNHSFKFYLDVEEYSQRHIVKAMVLDAANGRLARWAQGILDSSGAALSFLGYHDFLTFGPYHRRFFSATWLSEQCNAELGMLHNDRRLSADDTVSAEYQKLISDHKSSSGRIMVYFLPGPMPGYDVYIRRTLDVLIRQMAKRRNWLLIVKPKGRGNDKFIRDHMVQNQDLLSNGGCNMWMVVNYKNSEKEVCSARWLISHMDFGIGFNTVQVESICLNKPALYFFPVLKKTPLLDRVRAEGAAFKNTSALEAAVGEWMDNPERPIPAYEWCRRQFEPFTDGDALGRAARHLFRAV